MYDVSVDRKIKYYYEDELLEFQKINTMEKSKVESQESKPLFKVGDKVKIVPPKDTKNYRFGYVDQMRALEGKTVVITSCTEYTGDFSFPDDGYVYRINIGDDCFDWSSQSFEKAEEVKPQPLFKIGDKVKVIPPKDPNRYRFGYNSEMRKLEGRFAIITSCTYSSSKLYPDDNYIYQIDIDSSKLNWSSQSFERAESVSLFEVVDSLRVDDTLLTTYPIQCSKLSIFDCISDDKSAKEKEEKKEKYKLNFKIK